MNGKLILVGVGAFALVYWLRKAATADPVAFEELVDDPIYFEYDLSEINQSGKDRLTSLADLLNGGPWQSVILTGHADSAGGASYNQELGMRRAAAVAAFLDQAGLQKPDGSTVVIRSLGSSAPIASNDTPSGRALNRRVEIEIVL